MLYSISGKFLGPAIEQTRFWDFRKGSGLPDHKIQNIWIDNGCWKQLADLLLDLLLLCHWRSEAHLWYWLHDIEYIYSSAFEASEAWQIFLKNAMVSPLIWRNLKLSIALYFYEYMIFESWWVIVGNYMALKMSPVMHIVQRTRLKEGFKGTEPWANIWKRQTWAPTVPGEIDRSWQLSLGLNCQNPKRCLQRRYIIG